LDPIHKVKRKFGLENCSFDSIDEKLFNPSEPTGLYNLNMADNYDHSIMTELLKLATVKAGCSFVNLVFHADLTTAGALWQGKKNAHFKPGHGTGGESINLYRKGNYAHCTHFVRIISLSYC
jgi:hypothetical protein